MRIVCNRSSRAAGTLSGSGKGADGGFGPIVLGSRSAWRPSGSTWNRAQELSIDVPQIQIRIWYARQLRSITGTSVRRYILAVAG